jgi:hypothetical protein
MEWPQKNAKNTKAAGKIGFPALLVYGVLRLSFFLRSWCSFAAIPKAFSTHPSRRPHFRPILPAILYTQSSSPRSTIELPQSIYIGCN